MDVMDASTNMKTNEENSNEESKQNVEDGDAEEGFAEGEVAERGDADQDRGDDRGDEIEYSSDIWRKRMLRGPLDVNEGKVAGMFTSDQIR